MAVVIYAVMWVGGDWYTFAVFGFNMMVVVPPPPTTLLDRTCPAGATQRKEEIVYHNRHRVIESIIF